MLIHSALAILLASDTGGRNWQPDYSASRNGLSVILAEISPEERRFSPDPVSERQRLEIAETAVSAVPSPLKLPHYYVRSELNAPPRILVDPGLDDLQRFPTNEPGRLELRVFIDDRGHVDSVVVISSTLEEKWTKSAVAVFADAKFEPGRRDNIAVHSQIRITVGVGDAVE